MQRCCLQQQQKRATKQRKRACCFAVPEQQFRNSWTASRKLQQRNAVTEHAEQEGRKTKIEKTKKRISESSVQKASKKKKKREATHAVPELLQQSGMQICRTCSDYGACRARKKERECREAKKWMDAACLQFRMLQQQQQSREKNIYDVPKKRKGGMQSMKSKQLPKLEEKKK